MKKTLFFLVAAGALMMASCTKDVVPASESTEGIKLNINIAGPGGDTKAAKKAWATGDKLNIWFGVHSSEQTVPDIIITFNGTEWTAGALRTGCTPDASGKLTVVYEGYNDVSSTHYNYSWFYDKEWFSPKSCKVHYASYCRPLVVYAIGISYTFTSNTLTTTINGSDWVFQTKFKVLIKTHASMDKAADYYELQVQNTTASEYAQSTGAWIIVPDGGTYDTINTGSSNNEGKTGGVQEADGIAFYYTSFSASAADITFTLTEYSGPTKTYTVTGKTLDATLTDRCVGVALDYGSFAE